MSNQSKGFKEKLAQFFESPSRETLRELLRDNTGEYDDLDFKRELIEEKELAKDILGMANKSGGVIIFGIEENKEDKNLTAIGLSNLNDKTNFKSKLEKYIPSLLNFEVIDFIYDESEYPKIEGKSFRALVVEYEPKHISFLPKKESEKFKRSDIFTRHNTSTILADL